MGYQKGTEVKTAFETYTILRKIGGGGSGEVYEVADSDDKRFAIKALDPGKVTNVKLKRFRNEINFCSQSHHKNIIQVYGSGIAPDSATFYVMPLYAATLRSALQQGITPTLALNVFGQILDGVEAAHLKGVWHRDLKPENILLSMNLDKAIVADFGIAHFEEDELLTAVETKSDDRLANFLYAAPEQKIRKQTVDSKADVYALGLILNELFTQAPPLGKGHKTVGDVAGSYQYLDGIVDRMLLQDPVQRPSIIAIKTELIARGNEFLSLQKLDALKSQVIPDSEIDDPVVRNPIAIVSVDYQDQNMIFTLRKLCVGL